MPRPSLILGPLLLLSLACDGVPDELPPGTWGGDAALTVGGDTSRFVSGCLLVNLPGAIALDDGGRFSLPVPLLWIAPVARTDSGRVEGTLRKQRLTLRLTQNQAAVDLGTYVLRLGGPVPVDGCLLR